MANKLRRLQKATLVLGAATVGLWCVPYPTHAQSSTPQDRQVAQSDDITRRDLARFDQFLDSHHEISDQLRKTPSLIDDPQFLESHPEVNTYLQEHPSVKQEISQQPDTFMRLEDQYGRDANQRDRDAGGQDRDADRRGAANRDADNNRNAADRDADNRGAANRDSDNNRNVADRDAGGQDRDADNRGVAGRDNDRRDVANFDRFLDEHREIAEQVRKNPSLLDNRNFVQNHQDLQTYLQNNPGVRDQLRQDPSAFMRQEDAYDRDSNMREHDVGGDREALGRNVANFDRFLDAHREISEQVRKDPSLLDNRNFVQNHPVLQTYLQDNPGVRDQLRQDPNAFMRQEQAYDRDSNMRDRDPMHDHMTDFGGFLHSHSDIQKDLSRDPTVIKDHDYVQHHAELDAYLNAHPDVRAELMANPQSFVHGAQQYNANPSGSYGGAGGAGRGTGTTGSGTGTTGSGTGTTGSSTGTTGTGTGTTGSGTAATGSGTGTTGSMTGTSTNPATTTRQPSKPNQ